MMATRDLLERINSIVTMKQITQTMKLISVAKFSKIKVDLNNINNHRKELQRMFDEIFVRRPVQISGKDVVITISSDKGFCGGFNNNICKRTLTFLQEHKDIDIITIGKKINVFLTKRGYNSEFVNILEHYNRKSIKNFAEIISSRHYRNIYFIYNTYSNDYVIESIVPTKLIKRNSGILFDNDESVIVDALLNKILVTDIMKVVVESIVQENNTRMISMSKATDNAEALEKNLKIIYNQRRQAAITNEIIEITNCAMALK